MTVDYDPESSASFYKNYYINQAGGYIPVFQGKTIQNGSGIGGVFSRIFKGIAPMIKQGAKTVGKQLLNTGVNITHDVLNGDSFKDSSKKNLIAGGKNLLNNLQSAINHPKRGGAISNRKVKKNRNLSHSSSRSKRRRLSKDIFA